MADWDDTTTDALIELMGVVCTADHSLSREERAAIREAIERASGRSLLAPELDRRIVAATLALHAEERSETFARLRSGPLSSPGLCRLALDLAIEVALVDGLTSAERDSVLAACDALEVPRAYVEPRLSAASPYRDRR